MKRKPITLESLRRDCRKIMRALEQSIIDIEWWNTHRTDAPPMDCEPERVALANVKRELVALDRGDTIEAARISGENVEYMSKVCEEYET